jgi:hypothetical protein
LYNAGESDADLTGWQLFKVASGEVLVFQLSGTVSGGGYLLVERTTNSSPDPIVDIQDISGQFGGSGLRNTGEYLILKDSTGSVVDEVNALSAWFEAGDNTTKSSMERISADVSGSNPANWATWGSAAEPGEQVPCTGTDSGGNPIHGTPKYRNSVTGS